VKMELRRDDAKRTARAPAKLNLYLNVLGRREDGFHNLETVMLPIRIYDSLSLIPTRPFESNSTSSIELSVRESGTHRQISAEVVPSGPSNLVVRALELLRQRSGCELGAKVELVKRIPAAAGLGGGSSDAATALKLANSAWRLNWPKNRLAAVAAEIGSDVPFFLNGGAAVCRGRGEIVDQLPSSAPVHFVVVKPPFGLPTREVYESYATHSEVHIPGFGQPVGEIPEFCLNFVSGRISTWGQIIHNSLQAAASRLTTWVERLRLAFDRLDCAGHQLSGSGSAYFGVCRHAQHARRLATILRTRQLGIVYATRSCQ
jgi:4-diphosphocytidyl-2-C-methyl-D-erythritol kinase